MNRNSRPSHRFTALVLCLPFMLLGACAADKSPKPVVAQRLIEMPAKATLALTDSDADARVVVERTQTLVVSLALDGSQNPDWSVVDLAPGLLTLVGSKFVRAPRDIDAEESGGSTVFRFRPDAAGELTLKFELRKPRSTEPPLQTVSYAVTVK